MMSAGLCTALSLAALVATLAGLAQAELVDHFAADLSAQGVDPPVESDGIGHFDAYWTVSGAYDPAVDDTLALTVDFSSLSGDPIELRVYTGRPSGQAPRTVLVGGGEVLDGEQYRIPAADLNGDSLFIGAYWAALTTAAHPEGEIAGRMIDIFRVSSCGQFFRFDETCWLFHDYELGETNWAIHDPVLGEAGQVHVVGELRGETASCSYPYLEDLRVLSVGECTRRDLGCGVFYRDNLDGCHTWVSASLGRFLIGNIRSAADVDSVHIWGLTNLVIDVCVLGQQVLVDSVAACRDSLSPVVRSSWGTWKSQWSK